jgi:CRP-like cAMP-binding protein
VVLGEVSSFWGVLLSGELQVVIQGTNPVTLALRPGALVGEMAYFTRVPRSGTVVCSIAATMALMTFDELDALPATHSAELQCKIVRLLATKSIRKLEFNMNNMRAAEERQKVEETERELKLKNEETKRLGKKETLITQREKKALAPNEEFNKLSLSRSASVFPPSHSSNKPRRTPKGPQGETSQQRQERERAYFEKQAFDNEQKVNSRRQKR